MLDSKQRAYLRGLSHPIDPIFNVGKGGVSTEMVDSIKEALFKRELIKIQVLKNCPYEAKEIASTIGKHTKATVVQVIGRKITLYKCNPEEPIIKLPKSKKKTT